MRSSLDARTKRDNSSTDSITRSHEKSTRPSFDPDLVNASATYSHAATLEAPAGVDEAKLLRKIDLRVVPVLSVLYLFAFLDRTNISNAAIFGLSEDLGLVGTQYNTALTIFFVPYVLFEIPSNIILKRLKPHVWLSICMFGFGIVTVAQGLVQNWGGLMTTRALLGLTECGMFPGCFYLLSMWYKRSEAQKRFTFFFASTTLAGAFGGLLASAIGKLDGARGYGGWRWIFIIEGCVTCVFAFAWWFVIPDFPEDTKWLSPAERDFVKARLQADVGKSALDRRIKPKDVANCFKDVKFVLGGFMYFGLIVPAYGFAYFAPTIIPGYGYDRIQTQLHSVPPWVAAFGFSMIVAYFSDKFRHRFVFAIVPIMIAITGFAMVMTIHDNTNAQYAALHLITSGTYSAMPIIVCWFTMNLSGHHRRSVGSAWQIGFGNIGGIIATYSFQKKDAVNYWHTGYSICQGFICLSAAACLAYFVAIVYQNRQRERMTEDIGMTEYEKIELGDMNPDYRYML